MSNISVNVFGYVFKSIFHFGFIYWLFKTSKLIVSLVAKAKVWLYVMEKIYIFIRVYIYKLYLKILFKIKHPSIPKNRELFEISIWGVNVFDGFKVVF